MNKCETCGGEGLISQGESIKFTCSTCSGTGKSVAEVGQFTATSEVSASEPVPEVGEISSSESFLGESAELGELPAEVEVEASPV